MSIKTPQERLDYARKMLSEINRWATPQEIATWRNIISKCEKELHGRL